MYFHFDFSSPAILPNEAQSLQIFPSSDFAVSQNKKKKMKTKKRALIPSHSIECLMRSLN